MMVLDAERFVYVSTPKGATHTMYAWLGEVFGGRRIGRFHENGAEVLGQAAGYGRFTVVRNPYARAVSLWWSGIKAGYRFLLDTCGDLALEPWLDWLLEAPKDRPAVLPQTEWLKGLEPYMALRLEDLPGVLEALPFVQEVPQLPRRNESHPPDWRMLMTPAITEKIEGWAEADLHAFCYPHVKVN